jgi:hypothetical protein
MAEVHPADPLIAELTGLLDRSSRRLEGIIDAGLRRGIDPARVGTDAQRAGDATAAYRRRQLRQANAILDELRAKVGPMASIAAQRAYGAGVFAVGQHSAIDATFGRIHVAALDALTRNIGTALDAAIVTTGQNVATVFARADRLEGAVPVRGVLGLPFIGRRLDDPYRRAALEQVGQGVVALDTRRQVSAALARRLVTEGTTDALTGFVDRAGRRWSLEAYTNMVARTTTREAMSRGTVNRLLEGGLDLVTISSHPHQSDECDAYDGETFSLNGHTAGYDVLDVLPPFHPNCAHVVGPAEANLDHFERTLGGARRARG